jgi:hypothetical protein
VLRLLLLLLSSVLLPAAVLLPAVLLLLVLRLTHRHGPAGRPILCVRGL